MNSFEAEQYLKSYPAKGSTRLAEVYDDDNILADSVCTLFPGFEYPDFAYKTLSELRKLYERNSRSTFTA